jgi:hypothetical protein
VTGLIVFIFVKFFELRYLSLIALGLIVIWMVSAFYLKKGYALALMAAIEKRQLNFEELQLDVTDSDIISTIDQALNREEEARQVFTLELISDLSLEPWRKTLNRLFKEGSILVRRKILAMAGESPEIISNLDLLAVIQTQDALANQAIVVAGERGMTEILPTLAKCLKERDSHDPETVAAAATAVILMNQGPLSLARNTLDDMLAHPDKLVNIIVLRTLVNAPFLLSNDRVSRFLLSESPQVCYAALEIAERRNDAALVSGIATNLRHSQTAALARRLLRTYPAYRVFQALTTLGKQPGIGRQYTVEIIRTLKDYPTLYTIYYLIAFLDFSNPPVYAETVDAFLAIARRKGLPSEILNRAKTEIVLVAKRIYANYRTLDFIGAKAEERPLRELLEHDIDEAITVLLKLSVLHAPETPIEQYIYYVLAGDNEKIINVLEILDNIILGKVREIVTPLIEPIPTRERYAAGLARLKELPGVEGDLIHMIQGQSECRAAVALDYALRYSYADVLRQLDWEKVNDSHSIKDLISRYYFSKNGRKLLSQIPVEQFLKSREELSMFSTLEKTIILKGVDLFQGIPAEEVFYVAQIVEEERLPAGTTFIKEGDVGDSLYIIVSGAVRVHKDGRELNALRNGASLGEIALLDRGPRSASCTTLEETILLKIGQANFYDVMVSRVEFMRGVLKALSGQIRRLTDLYTQAS